MGSTPYAALVLWIKTAKAFGENRVYHRDEIVPKILGLTLKERCRVLID